MPYRPPVYARPKSPLGATLATSLNNTMPGQMRQSPGQMRQTPVPAPAAPPPITTAFGGRNPIQAPMQAPMATPGPGMMQSAIQAPVQTPMAMSGAQLTGASATSGLSQAGSDAVGNPVFYNATTGMYVDQSGTGISDPGTISNWQPGMDPRSINATNNPGGMMMHPGQGFAQPMNPQILQMNYGMNALGNPGNFGVAPVQQTQQPMFNVGQPGNPVQQQPLSPPNIMTDPYAAIGMPGTMNPQMNYGMNALGNPGNFGVAQVR